MAERDTIAVHLVRQRPAPVRERSLIEAMELGCFLWRKEPHPPSTGVPDVIVVQEAEGRNSSLFEVIRQVLGPGVHRGHRRRGVLRSQHPARSRQTHASLT